MKFKSRKDNFFSILTIGLVVFCVGLSTWILLTDHLRSLFPLLIILIPATVLLLWIYFGTYYELSADYLIYKCGPLKGKVRLDRIRTIVKGKTSYIGVKPATALNGLIIKYDRFEELYITPSNNNSFLKYFSQLNKEVEIEMK